MKSLNVLYQSNDAYAAITGISLTSLFINNSDIKINVYILNNDIDKTNINKFKKLCNQYHNDIHFIDTNKTIDKIKSLGVTPYGGNYATYLRIFLINDLPDDVDTILSIDGDTIVTSSIKELCTLNMDKYLCAGVCDSTQNCYKDYINVPRTDNYYNGGVTVFNVKKWKKDNCEQIIEKHLKTVRNKYYLGDQDILNVLFRNQYLKLDITYNFNSGFYIYGIYDTFYLYDLKPKYYYTYATVKKYYDNPKILHCMGAMTGRPWEKDNIHPQKQIFLEYKNKSLWKDEPQKVVKRSLMFRIQRMLYLILPRNLYLKIHKTIHLKFMKKMNMDATNDVKIYMFCFNKSSIINKECYYNIYAGSNKENMTKKLTDSSGDNISNRNFSFCELTGLYWVWKNVPASIVGFEHYRRYFYKKGIVLNTKNVLTSKKIQKILSSSDIIVPEKSYVFPDTIYKNFISNHIESDLDMCKDIIKKKYPDYIPAFDKVFNAKYYYANNMFIAKKSISDEYSKWLFDILLELDKKIDYDNRDSLNRRACGFLGERLFNVWLEKNSQYKKKEYPVYNVEHGLLKQELVSFVKKIISIFSVR